MCPTLYYIREAVGLIEFHVDDGHGCGKEEVSAELLTFLSEKIEIKYVQGTRHGSYGYLKTTKMRHERNLTSIPNKKFLQSAMDKLVMGDCKRSVSPKLDKATMERDGEELGEDQKALFRSSVLTLLYLSSERTDIQSTVRHLCTKLQSPTALEIRQLKRLLRCVKGTEDMATVFIFHFFIFLHFFQFFNFFIFSILSFFQFFQNFFIFSIFQFFQFFFVYFFF